MHFKISEINQDRWQELDRLFQAAIKLEPRQRTDLIDSACSGDPVLREEIEALLRSDAEAWSFLEEPALQLAAPFVVDEQPQLAADDQLGDYTIQNLIGRGGMGEVYLAKDRVLNRRVALKVLPVEYTRDKNRLQRFQNEAQAASALNHPNILTIYQLGNFEGLQFIVTEFVEGKTIRELITSRGLDLKQVLDVTIQISSALAAAHKAGIVHRDIKPENIMLRPDGYVKVLDFGLAKLAEPAAAADKHTSDVATASHANISSALLMGTVRYMSPEQARGLRVDARSDIFSLGVMLYEMIAGRVPFENNDLALLIDSILHEDPMSPALRTDKVPAELVAVATKALHKDREQRYQSADDLLIDLRALKTVQENTSASTLKRFVSAISQHKVVATMTLVLITLASITGYMWYKRQRTTGASISGNASKYVFTGRWTTKGSIALPRRDAELAVLDGTLYVAGGWNTCTPYSNLESYDRASDRWTARTPMRTARGGHGMAALNGLLYVVGGHLDCASHVTASVEAYDPKTGQWSERAPLPTARGALVVAALNGKLYAIGGEYGTQKLALNTEYDPATDTWTDRAPLPSPRIGAAVVVVDNLIYLIGGGPRAEDLTSMQAYDPVIDRWTSKAPMPIGRDNFGAAFLNGTIYAFGGQGNSGQVDAYDPVTDSWSTGPSMPSPRGGFRAVTLNGSIYFAGGQDESSHLSSVMSFTPCADNGRWTTEAPMPTARKAAASAQIDGIIFVVGGFSGTLHFHADNEAYDLASNTWTAKTPMPTARELSGTNGAVVAGKMYVIGGNAKGYCTNANEAYDPKTDTWKIRAPMPTPRALLAVVALDGLIYAVGGTNTSSSIRYQTVEVYNPVSDTWTTAPPMPTARQHLAAGVINGILYVAGGWKTTGSLNTLEAFDPKRKTWTTKAPMPTPRFNHAAGVLNGSLFVVGGVNNLTLVSTVDVYDPASNAWTTFPLSLPTVRHQPAVVAANDVLFVIGGSPDLEGTKYVTNNEEFIPPMCWGQTAEGSTPR
ncbi:MAG TPA: kelch repeat-containing protein [Pyrinomonadaceae bacterium]|nr:kelch repeat-containing protein [Pyrinomonadaceae bacterium]